MFSWHWVVIFINPKGKNKFCQYNISYDLYNSNVFKPVQVNIYYASGRLWTDCCGDTNE